MPQKRKARQRLSPRLADRTSHVVAHRLSTILIADQTLMPLEEVLVDVVDLKVVCARPALDFVALFRHMEGLQERAGCFWLARVV